MRYTRQKYFWKATGKEKKVVCIPIPDDEDYYGFVQRLVTSGFHQIIITSAMMLQIICDLISCGFVLDQIDMQDMQGEQEINRLHFSLRNGCAALFVQVNGIVGSYDIAQHGVNDIVHNELAKIILTAWQERNPPHF